MKKIISLSLALILMFGIFNAAGVSAADVKILASKTIKVGQTADVRLSDPNTGAKLNTLWESSNPSVATVTSDGKVTAVKAGTCIVSTIWNSKVYGVSITVTGSSSSSTTTTTTTTSSKTSAFTKLKNYLIKSGTKQANVGSETIYYIKWENKSYRYWVSYNVNGKYIEYAIVPRKDAKGDLGRLRFIQYEEKNTVTVYFDWSKEGRYSTMGSYSKNYKKSTFNIKKKVKLKYSNGKKYSNANSLANKYRKKLYSAINSKIKKKTGLSFKSLGMEYTKKAKKVSISKKSATITKGKTLKLKLKNAKASKVKWSSSKKKVASVSKKGKVKAKKKGKATITAKYKGKKYKCKITVKAKAKKKSITVKQAFNKLKKYLISKGTKYPENSGTNLYQVTWKKQGFTYALNYSEKYKNLFFRGEYETSSVDLIIDLYVDIKSKSECQFYSKTNNDESTHYYMFANFVKKSFVLENIPDFKFDGGNNQGYDKMNMNAKAALEWMFPDFNSYISKKAGVTMKQLGFKKWK